MSRFLKVFLVLSLLVLFPTYCFAGTLSSLYDALVSFQVSVADVLHSLLFFVIGVGTAVTAIFYAGRIMKELRVVFSLPSLPSSPSVAAPPAQASAPGPVSGPPAHLDDVPDHIKFGF
jgi:hypothetical protein